MLKASAGSGKTRALTKRFVRFLLSADIHNNSLKNIIAITFSNNASREMRQRIVLWLKELSIGRLDTLNEISAELGTDNDTLQRQAEAVLDEIFEGFSSFQVRTIDSFMTSIFKASALDMGYNPDFDILLDYEALMEYAFEVFLRRIRHNSKEAALMHGVIDLIHDSRQGDRTFLWEPTATILREIKAIYRKLASTGARLVVSDHYRAMETVKHSLRRQAESLNELIERSQLERSGTSAFANILENIRTDRFADLINHGIKNPPVKKPTKKNPATLALYDDICTHWSNLVQTIRQYIKLYSQVYYTPFIRVYKAFEAGLDQVKRQQGRIFIDDISHNLSLYLNQGIVPDVYFRLGQSLCHYLIDEFQDTSPIQWKNLTPLVENSLSQGGSLFVVGDTKQAIYGFRNADYQIMKGLEHSAPFPCAAHRVEELDTNHRSLQTILSFNEAVFKGLLPNDEDYSIAGNKSGLTNYTQLARSGNPAGGYAEVRIVELDEENQPEKAIVQAHVEELRNRGYRYRDIAILTDTNDNVVQTAAWLNERGIDFVSFSSLDIRTRRLTAEIVSLLNFLDSPLDDLSFAAFCLGDILATAAANDAVALDRGLLEGFFLENRSNTPRYKAFQESCPELWTKYFEGLFKSVGYLPLYDLVSDVYGVFRVFETFNDEEATLVKLLEVIKNYEDIGNETIRDFLEYASDQDRNQSDWNIDVPKSKDAVAIMTVHKAKGLGFPVVIALLYGQNNKGFDYLIDRRDTDEVDDTAVTILKVNKKIVAAVGESLSAAYEAERLRDKVNRLNALYVAFTRAKAELYVVGVKGAKVSYPFNLLPVDEFQPRAPDADKPDAVHLVDEPESEPFPLLYHRRGVDFATRQQQDSGLGIFISGVARQRGKLIHRVLSLIDYNVDVTSQLEAVIERVLVTSTHVGIRAEVADILRRFFMTEGLMEIIGSRVGREFLKEQEFAVPGGMLLRMDLVVVDASKVVVVDFKVSIEDSPAHEQQVKNYVRILRDYFRDRRVEGIIAYVEQPRLMKV
ncbi:UvrD/REP helicase domain protein [Candidatus Magnetobacterium bavaricum]|uniref:DNA 3'-5' helicase n=1 Tax=Candidatus Magnetobacterium bavaricum TaxID=29290 RepID=A0A0F3GN69_9BACT|nr:UvrD/REP helicase domain protein [Candidatus Magnetobacterium bavaricum]